MNTFGCRIAIIFNGILDASDIIKLNDYLLKDSNVTEFHFDRAEIEMDDNPAIDCTSLLIDLNTMFDIMFRMRFEQYSGGKLMPWKENRFVYFYVV